MKDLNCTEGSTTMQEAIPTEARLRSGALGLSGVLMQGITHIAPATATLFTIQLTTSYAGVTAPLAYLVAFLIVMMLGVSLTQLAKHFPSAGGYYTYVSRTVSPRAGFLTSWLFFIYEPTNSGYCLAFVASVLERALMAEYQIVFPWWLFFLMAGAFVTWVTFRGIELSATMLLVFGIAEVAIVFLLSMWGLFQPGHGGINFSSFHPGNARSLGGLSLAVIFSIFALTGWEGVAPLAEESKNPRRNQPRAIIAAILFMGGFLVLCSWGLLVGWGTEDVRTFVGSVENPTFVLARRLWGHAWIMVLLALLNSMIAVAIATNNGATRVWFAMARSGSLPRALAKVHPRFQTPVNAVILQAIVTLAVGLGLGVWIGPDKEFELMGAVVTFALIFIYSAGNLGVFLLYSRERRTEFHWVLHAVFPFLGTVALVFVGYSSLVPWPTPPVAYAPWMVGIWLGLGIAVLVVMKLTGREQWMLKAGNVTQERSDHPKH
jgi:amino acid transporter